MPEIKLTVHVNPDWMNVVDPKEDWTPQQKLMDSVLRRLPGIVCGVVNDARRENSRFQRALGTDRVRLIVVPVHSWSRNVPDLSVEVCLDEIEGDEKSPQDRRWSTARDVGNKIFQFLDNDETAFLYSMSYLVECVLLSSSGIIRPGSVDNKWGVPDYDKMLVPHYVSSPDEGRGDELEA